MRLHPAAAAAAAAPVDIHVHPCCQCTGRRPWLTSAVPMSVQLFNVWVEPLVHVTVRLLEGDSAAASAVVIEATNWSLRGSDLIESLGLNRRFSLAFTAQLTWTPAPVPAPSSNGSGAQNGNLAAPGTGAEVVVMLHAYMAIAQSSLASFAAAHGKGGSCASSPRTNPDILCR